MVTKAEFNLANQRAREMQETNPQAVSAKYNAEAAQVEVHFNSGLTLMFPPRIVEGLENASPSQLSQIEISPSGFGIHFPQIDADLFLPSLLEGHLGSKSWMAARLGAAGGHSRSRSKAMAARENGKLGGRPKHRKAAAGPS
jgi:hypothetical protein